jgi:hypothetical protein
MMLTVDRVTEIVRGYIEREVGDPRAETIDANTKLLQSGLVDSFSIVALAEEVADACGLDPEQGQLVPDDFQSPKVLFGRLERMLGRTASSKEREGDDEPPPIVRTNVPDGSVYSYWQDIIATWERTREPTKAWTRPVLVRLRGPVDRSLLESAIRRILDRQDSLRQLFAQDPKARPGLCDASAVPIRHVAMTNATDADVEALFIEELARPFLLDGTPMCRFIIVDRGERATDLLLYYHQLVHDATQAGMIVEEILESYGAQKEQRPEQLEPLKIRYVDFAAWEREYFEGRGRPRVEAAKNYIANARPLNLPKDFPPGAKPGSLFSRIAIGPEPSARFTELCEKHGTVFAGICVVTAILLGRWCKEQDVTFFTPVSTRWRSEYKHLLGRFGSLIPIRISLADDPRIGDLIKRETADGAGVRAFTAPPAQLVYGTEDVYAHPLTRVGLNTPGIGGGRESGAATIADVTADILPPPFMGHARSDINIILVHRGGCYSAELVGQATLFEMSTLERWAKELEKLLITIREDARVSDLVG